MCLGTNMCGHKRVWAQACVGTNVSGHKGVWAQTCLGTIMSGHNREGSSMYGHNVWSPLLRFIIESPLLRSPLHNLAKVMRDNLCHVLLSLKRGTVSARLSLKRGTVSARNITLLIDYCVNYNCGLLFNTINLRSVSTR